jgi:formate hydrogenlyase subunit 3/multisubunit Na+/H+ antiporter MnhD subunit
MKITLFLCAGAIAAITGKKAISDLAGMGRALPVTLSAFIIGAFGMCGAPPLAGFISKWHIGLGAVESGVHFFLLIILIGSFLDVVYFFPVIRTAFFDQRPKDEALASEGEERADIYTGQKQVLESRQAIYLLMIVPLAITAIFSILFCLFPNILRIYDLAQTAVNHTFGGM